MSSPLDRDFGPDEPSPFAPKWVRDAAHVERRGAPPTSQQTIDDNEARSPLPAPEEGLAVDHDPVPPSLGFTEISPEPSPVLRARTGIGALVLRFAVVMAIGAIGALFVVGKFPPWTIAGNDHKEQPPSFDSRFSGQDARNAAQSKPVVPQLNLGRGAALKAGEAFPLGNSLSGTVEGASLVIEGLASGSMVTAGRSWGANTWRIPVTDLQDARVHPPRDYSGPMDLIVELRLADDTVADRKLLHLEWAAAAKPVPAVVAKSAPAVATTPPSPAAAAPSAPAAAAPSAPAAAAPSAPVAATPPTPIRYLERDEISDLVRRGEAFIASGDLASARLVLQRAAEAGDAKAALTLAGTYDPITLEKLGIYGFASDIGKARAWYERAKAFGSAEASQRLEMLVSRDH